MSTRKILFNLPVSASFIVKHAEKRKSRGPVYAPCGSGTQAKHQELLTRFWSNGYVSMRFRTSENFRSWFTALLSTVFDVSTNQSGQRLEVLDLCPH